MVRRPTSEGTPGGMRLAVAALALAACGDDGLKTEGPATGVVALYDTSSARADFFALPWPMDRRMTTGADGKKHLDLTGFYDPGGVIGEYLDLFGRDDADGFGTSAAIYFRFDGPVDPASLPQSPAASLDPAASVFLVDATPGSPTFGRRQPVRARFAHDAGAYIGSDWLAILPEPGFPLRQRTRYAAVVTDRVHGTDSAPVRRDAGFAVPPDTVDALGVDPARVVSLASYTTTDATHRMRELREAVYAQVADPPRPADFRYVDSDAGGRFDHYEGSYLAPNFQEGDPPYLRSGGRIHLGADGKPAVVRTEMLRFAVTVPRGTMPAAGWPIVLYAHGTGGSYTTFIADGSAAAAAAVRDAGGQVVARMAMIGIDQVLHGPRDPTGTDPALTFYNFQNLESARDSVKQGAADDFSLVRLVENLDVAAAPGTGARIKFDPARIYFKGHSQGGTTGPLFLAFEPKIRAAVLSGAGAMLILALLEKTEPVNIPVLVQAIVREDVDEFHPLLNLLQTYLESADPGNYARSFFREPPTGVPPKSIYQSLGIVDHFTPIPTIKALALAMGVQPATPMLEPIDALPLAGLGWAAPPIARNVAGNQATGALAEYQVPKGSDGTQAYDGHFVVFQHPDAIRQSNRFLATHAATGTATLVP